MNVAAKVLTREGWWKTSLSCYREGI